MHNTYVVIEFDDNNRLDSNITTVQAHTLYGAMQIFLFRTTHKLSLDNIIPECHTVCSGTLRHGFTYRGKTYLIIEDR